RGYALGRMLQQGCLIPARGGLCQLSNALYDTALQAECEIVERHAHSQTVPESAAVVGRDATVAWNYVDLKFRPHKPVRIEARLTRDELVIRLRGQSDTATEKTSKLLRLPEPIPSSRVARSCATCGETECFRHEHPADDVRSANARDMGRCAFLV